MNVIVDFCLIPMGDGISVARHVAECQRILQAAGLSHQLHAYGTNIEGDWETVMSAIKKCHETVHGMGAPRINTTLKIGTRNDRDQSMQEKIDRVETLLGA